tara:strand:+ start:31726 stop:32487 length:762 start_codon:yes stop_codon:yes gene_type:complete
MDKITDITPKNATPISREDAIEALFANVPKEVEVEVQLPSKGKFYENFNGVRVKPLLFEDEQRILSTSNRGVDAVNGILRKCVDGVPIESVVLFDKIFLLMKVREISYGAEYNFPISCPKCGAGVTTTIDIAKHLDITYVEDDLEDPRTIRLPTLDVDVEVRFPRVIEESYLSDVDTIIKNLHRFVVSIADTTDPVFINTVLKRLAIRDMKTISNAILKNDYGVDPRFNFECPTCKHIEVLNVPLDAHFFSVS